jgi:hypothetical protein
MSEQGGGIASRAAEEQLRQERETFELYKEHQQYWFALQLRFGYASIVILLVIMGVFSYPVLRPDLFRTEAVILAAIGLLADMAGWVLSVWRIVLDPKFRIQLAPVTNVQLSDRAKESDGGLSILSARYGVGESWKDVAEILRSSISEGSLSIQVTNNTLGHDPAPGMGKTLEVIYSHAGRTYTRSIHETGWLHLP